MRRVAAMFAVMLAGCTAPFAAERTCAVGAEFRMVVHLEVARDCAYYDALAADAIDTILATGLVPPELLRERVTGVEVWVWDSQTHIRCGSFAEAWGCYHPTTQTLEVNRAGSSLLHELLHHIERSAHGPNGHENWDTLGAAVGAPIVQVERGVYARQGSWLHVANAFEWKWHQRGASLE